MVRGKNVRVAYSSVSALTECRSQLSAVATRSARLTIPLARTLTSSMTFIRFACTHSPTFRSSSAAHGCGLPSGDVGNSALESDGKVSGSDAQALVSVPVPTPVPAPAPVSVPALVVCWSEAGLGRSCMSESSSLLRHSMILPMVSSDHAWRVSFSSSSECSAFSTSSPSPSGCVSLTPPFSQAAASSAAWCSSISPNDTTPTTAPVAEHLLTSAAAAHGSVWRAAHSSSRSC